MTLPPKAKQVEIYKKHAHPEMTFDDFLEALLIMVKVYNNQIISILRQSEGNEAVIEEMERNNRDKARLR